MLDLLQYLLLQTVSLGGKGFAKLRYLLTFSFDMFHKMDGDFGPAT